MVKLFLIAPAAHILVRFRLLPLRHDLIASLGLRRAFAILLFAVASSCGCTGLSEYVHNGFKVGPNYKRPAAPLAYQWIDANDVRVRSDADDLSQWWHVFNDPALDSLICLAYQQNLTLREAGFRVLQARSQRNIATGTLFPQSQQMFGDYSRIAVSKDVANRSNVTKQFFSQWDYGLGMAWELDFWGRFRRAVESAEASLDASVENYDDVLVILLSDVAANYVQFRTFQKQVEYAQANVQLQRETLAIVENRFEAGTTTELDVVQASSTLEQTEAQVYELLISLRTANNQLCTLLGIPPEELSVRLGTGPVPKAPTEVAAGIPADLLRRRPDVRRAERQVAAQSAQIGIAQADLYPHISLTGTIGYSAERSNNLFQPNALEGSIGPSFQWNILNYGRIRNNVLLQQAAFQELIAAYQSTVLSAAQEVEDGLVTFLRGQQRTQFQAAAVADAERAVRIAVDQYSAGTIDFTRVTQVQENLVGTQNTLAQAEGEIALGLIQVYRALGGGWQIRCTGCEPIELPPPVIDEAPPEELPEPEFPTPAS